MSIQLQPHARWLVRDSPIFINRYSTEGFIKSEEGNSTFTEHHHEFDEIIVIHSGRAIHSVCGREVRAFPGQVFIIRPGMTHFFHTADALCLSNVMYIPWRLSGVMEELREMPRFNELFLMDPDGNGSETDGRADLVLNHEEQAVARDLTDRMIRESTGRLPGYKAALRGMLIELMVLLCRTEGAGKTPRSGLTGRLALLLGSLEERFYESWTLERMSEAAACSIPSLARRFRRFFNDSPMDYLISLRINRVKKLLLHTDLTVTEIAYQTGFKDSSYLTRQFKSRTGMTPRQYRNGRIGS